MRRDRVCALGSANSAALLSEPEKGGHADFHSAQLAIISIKLVSCVHTHSRNAGAFAQGGRGITCLAASTQADNFYGEVPGPGP
jgi:ribulose-5-phosphate 4-epimerase/fuculose-1-phosphate aldolase